MRIRDKVCGPRLQRLIILATEMPEAGCAIKQRRTAERRPRMPANAGKYGSGFGFDPDNQLQGRTGSLH
jgi:hypothetical protein